jgi:hypothetical protein
VVEWRKQRENNKNMEEEWRDVASNAGERHPRHKLTEEVVRQIKKLCEEGKKPGAIGVELGLKYHTVYSVITKRRWREVQ